MQQLTAYILKQLSALFQSIIQYNGERESRDRKSENSYLSAAVWHHLRLAAAALTGRRARVSSQMCVAARVRGGGSEDICTKIRQLWCQASSLVGASGGRQGGGQVGELRGQPRNVGITAHRNDRV